ncbi:hypothetical protein P3672_17690 [Vibrio parahaemolyticus]|nr:hypothetical protein [Vibrio parahaemolyticus]
MENKILFDKIFKKDNYITPDEAEMLDDFLLDFKYSTLKNEQLQIIDDYLSCRILMLKTNNPSYKKTKDLIVLSDMIRNNHL